MVKGTVSYETVPFTIYKIRTLNILCMDGAIAFTNEICTFDLPHVTRRKHVPL